MQLYQAQAQLNLSLALLSSSLFINVNYFPPQAKEMQEIVTLACEKWAAGDKVQNKENKNFSKI